MKKNKEEKIEKVRNRIKSIEKYLKMECPEIIREQKHLDKRTERDYWHYGYLMALKDIIRNFILVDKDDWEKYEKKKRYFIRKR